MTDWEFIMMRLQEERSMASLEMMEAVSRNNEEWTGGPPRVPWLMYLACSLIVLVFLFA
jgi:hypothetical protein